MDDLEVGETGVGAFRHLVDRALERAHHGDPARLTRGEVIALADEVERLRAELDRLNSEPYRKAVIDRVREQKAEIERLRARNDDTPSPGWSVEVEQMRIILGEA